MVKGAIKALDVDYAMATSGIAGPGGGSPEKPVGTIWVAAGTKDAVREKYSGCNGKNPPIVVGIMPKSGKRGVKVQFIGKRFVYIK